VRKLSPIFLLISLVLVLIFDIKIIATTPAVVSRMVGVYLIVFIAMFVIFVMFTKGYAVFVTRGGGANLTHKGPFYPKGSEEKIEKAIKDLEKALKKNS
jgi:energy-coupling factor transporter transmembrane protein EcfT